MEKYFSFKFQQQTGNALFLILIAVALFAALSYAVTTSGRGGGTTNKEQTALLAAQIASMVSVVQQGVMRAILMGTPASSVLCESAPNGQDCGAGSANGSKDFCTTGSTCLFAPDGGGLIIPQVPQAAYNLSAGTCTFFANKFSGPTSWRGFLIDGFNGGGADSSIAGVGTAANDDMVFMYCLKQEVCEAINKGLGITGVPNVGGTWSPMTNVDPGTQAVCVYDATYGYTYSVVLNAN